MTHPVTSRPSPQGRADIAAVVVTYHPGSDLVGNVEAALAHAGVVTVVDNTPGAEAPAPVRALGAVPGVEVVRYGENRGLGVALNAGLADARRRGAVWLLTLDQDTRLYPAWGDVVAEALRSDGSGTAVVGVGFRNPALPGGPEDGGGVREVAAVITSGSVWSVAALGELGGFREDLFVDAVDVEMCLRVRAAGLRVVESGRRAMDHSMGTPRWATWMGRPFHRAGYGPVRYYYIFRNSVALFAAYGRGEGAWVRHQARILGWLVKSALAGRRADTLWAAAHGVLDGLRGRYGAAPAAYTAPGGAGRLATAPEGPAVSVALATYNGERYLAEQLASIAGQTRPPAELVAVDDGSTDGTLGVLRAFAETAPFPVRVHENDRPLGYRDAFLRAASLCRGPWVAFSDQDDVWLPGKLAAVDAAVRAEPGAVLVTHAADLVGPDLRPLGARLPDYRRRRVAGPLGGRPLRVLTGFTLAFERSLLDGVPLGARPRDVNDPARPLAHDQVVPFLANVLGRTVYLPRTLALYRRHGGAATGEAGTGLYRTDLRSTAALHARSTADDYAWHAELAAEHAAFLDALADREGEPKTDRVRRGAAYYRRYARALARRALVHDRRRPRAERAAGWAGLLRDGLYRRVGPGAGLGWRACAKDLALGVLR